MPYHNRTPRQRARRPQADDRLHYRELSGLWLQWLQRQDRMPMDRWLRKNNSKGSALRQQPALAQAM